MHLQHERSRVSCQQSLFLSWNLPQSSDAQEFQVEEDVAFQSETVKNMIEDTGADFAVPLPNVNGVTLSKVLEYCNKHRWETQVAICLVLAKIVQLEIHGLLCQIACSEHKKLVDKAPDDHAKRALEKAVTQWDKDFIDVDQNVLYFVTLAANYLNIKDLL